MFYTVRGLLENRGVALEDTVYKDCNPRMLDFKIASGDFYEIPNEENGILRFKNSADLFDFEMLKEILPDLQNINFRHKDFFPFYGENLEAIEEAIRVNRDKVAVEGGPCLFGEHEVDCIITLNDGSETDFDYSTGKKYNNLNKTDYAQSDGDLASFIEVNASEIKNISFVNHKTGLTYQEYLHVFFPFAVAAALNVHLVMTLPDMSYRKYLLYSLKPLDEESQKKYLAEFDEILYKITDMYIELIYILKAKFQMENMSLVHGRDEKMIEIFEEKRKPYIERNKVLRSLTNNPAKLESIKDYISMPALPFYIYDSEFILEVNSMDETDSYRKCRKAHKNLTLGCILFPELLSDDGINTLYCAPLEYKEYGNYKSELE
ncbi:MAG: hypothetical protein IK151_01400 [Erysipelotrichaceae bacterium]|nr:hypothetical protein [Erysipelotrichaceae bacterium]